MHLDQEKSTIPLSLHGLWCDDWRCLPRWGTDQWCPYQQTGCPHRLSVLCPFSTYDGLPWLFPVWKRWTRLRSNVGVSGSLEMVQLAGFENVRSKIIWWSTPAGITSGYYQWTTSGPFRWALVCTSDLETRTDMQYELRELQQRLGLLLFLLPMTKKKLLPWVTGSLSWTKERSSNWYTSRHLWWANQPLCSYLYRESNILDGRMIEDWLSSMATLWSRRWWMHQTNQLESLFVLKTCKSIFLKVSSKRRWYCLCIMRSSPMMILGMSNIHSTQAISGEVIG